MSAGVIVTVIIALLIAIAAFILALFAYLGVRKLPSNITPSAWMFLEHVRAENDGGFVLPLGPYELALQHDGNLVIYDAADKVLWQSGTIKP